MDLITAAGSLNYADLDRVFPEASRILTPQGVLAVYDFGPGQVFDKWFEEFQHRYPLSNEKRCSGAIGFA